MGSMKVHHQFARGLWEHESPSLTLGCKRLRPLVPKLQNPSNSQNLAMTTTSSSHIASFDLKSFIRPDSGPRKPGSPHHQSKDPPQMAETHPGGTRWNPTQEQIGILEMLYRGGMRTPNAQQIEQISVQLAKYGKIEGKNVFYWFQNHKARERQKQKRNRLGLSHSPRTPPSPTLLTGVTLEFDNAGAAGILVVENSPKELEESPYKRKCRGWEFERLVELESKSCSSSSSSSSSYSREEEERNGDRTLELFPLHPEGR